MRALKTYWEFGLVAILLAAVIGVASAQDRNRDTLGGSEVGTAEGMPDAADIPPAIGYDGRPSVPEYRPTGWKLGVWATTSKTGCRVTRVVSRGAAERAGIEPGDVIISVDGFVVGSVADRTYYLGEELQKRADERGKVSVLLLDWRSRSLIAVDDLQLDGGTERDRSR